MDLGLNTADALRRLANHVPSMLAHWDCDLKCRFANRAYETWFGADPDRLTGTSLRELLGAELFAINEPFIAAVLRDEEQTFERVIPGSDGIERHSLANDRSGVVGGRVVGFVVSVTEVTQLKRVEAELRSAVGSLEGEISHRRKEEDRLALSELRTPGQLRVAAAVLQMGSTNHWPRLGRTQTPSPLARRLSSSSTARAALDSGPMPAAMVRARCS